MASENRFSAEYWQLHRNTLIFSSALLIVSISSTKNGLSVLGLSLENIGPGAITFLLAIAASYSFFAFALEWGEECWPRVRPALSTIDEIQKSGQVASDRLDQGLTLLTEQVDFFRQHRVNLKTMFPAFLPDEVQEILASARAKMERKLNPDESHEDDEDFLAQRRIENPLILRGADQMASYAAEMWHESGNMKITDLTAQISEFERGFEQIKSDISAIKKWQSRAKIRLFIPLTADMLRSMVVAMIFPAILYVSAFAHGLGRLGFNIFDYSLLRFFQAIA